MRGCGTFVERSLLSRQDRRELNNFVRYLAIAPVHLPRMLTRPRWQRYLGLDRLQRSAAGTLVQPASPSEGNSHG
jgi:hypothetical protein